MILGSCHSIESLNLHVIAIITYITMIYLESRASDDTCNIVWGVIWTTSL
jgi:hypothetical protein